ncbi:hypothetical protein [Nostoc sp.]|uniref:hypothetical protein n=1 Tax=Nostoc sp. TaxID=1180 RepID=UPI002FF620AD
MQSALDQFRISIQRVRDLIALHTSVKAQATAVLDLSDILRAALVLTVSALDYYIHEVATIMSKPSKDIKQQLTLIVDRRNKIAHEADIDPTLNIGNRWYIDESMVGDTVDYIGQVVESIHQIL